MNNDDSFNDSEEIISLYSSKKVKETFKTQLQKIVSNSHIVNLSKEISEEVGKNGEPTCKKNVSVNNSPKSPDVLFVNSTSKRPLEDAIEIISEITPLRKTRQSERLRKKRDENIVKANPSCGRPPRKPLKKNKNGKKDKKKGGLPIDVIVLDDSEPENETEEDFNPEVSVKIIWKSVKVKKFQMRKFQKFSKIFQMLSEEENIAEEKIMLTFNNTKVCKSDTPDSLNLQVYHFLDGGVLSELSNSHENSLGSNSLENKDMISLKFQDFNKKTVKVKINKKEKMKVGMIKCSEQLEIPYEKIKFYFDGELLEPLKTPETLGLDNDEIIDIKVIS